MFPMYDELVGAWLGLNHAVRQSCQGLINLAPFNSKTWSSSSATGHSNLEIKYHVKKHGDRDQKTSYNKKNDRSFG